MNQVNLLGRLSKDVELRFTREKGTAIANFTLAVNRKFKKDEADFISCVAIGKTAEIINRYFSKGSQIAISGNIRTGSYETQDGARRYTTNIVVENFDLIGGNNKQENKVNEFEEEMNRIEDGYVPF